MKWGRVTPKGAVSRDVDVTSIEQMLMKRTRAKQAKDYTAADALASQLRDLGVCYDDKDMTWYTRSLEAAHAAKAKRKRADDDGGDDEDEADNDGGARGGEEDGVDLGSLSLSTALSAAAALVEARAWAGGAGARVRILDGRRGDAALVEVAAKVRDTRDGGVGVGGLGARAPQLLRDRGEARPHRLLQIGRVDGLAPPVRG